MTRETLDREFDQLIDVFCDVMAATLLENEAMDGAIAALEAADATIGLDPFPG